MGGWSLTPLAAHAPLRLNSGAENSTIARVSFRMGFTLSGGAANLGSPDARRLPDRLRAPGRGVNSTLEFRAPREGELRPATPAQSHRR